MIHRAMTYFWRAARRTKLELDSPLLKSSTQSFFQPETGIGSCYTFSLLLLGQALVPACSLGEAAVGVVAGLCVHCLYRQLYTQARCTG